MPPWPAGAHARASSPARKPWLARTLAAGRLPFTAHHSEKDVPQGFNLDRIGAVDFKKGCYLGQEIVARLHYRGQPKRRLYRGESTAALPVGEAVRDGSREPPWGRACLRRRGGRRAYRLAP